MNKDTIYIDVDDEITTITDKLQNSKNKLVALVLPKHCVVLQSAVNMKILNKISKDNNKTIVLITAEASILSIAGVAGVHVAKTLQSKPYLPDASGAEEPNTSIDSGDDAETIDSSKPIGELAVGAGIELDDDAPIELGDETTDKVPSKGDDKKNKKLRVPNFEKFRLWVILAIVGAAILIGGGVYAAKALPRATIVITTQNQSVPVSLVVTGSPAATTVDLANKIVPAEVKTIEQPVSATFQATGEKNNGNKATGTMTITNCINDGESHSVPAGASFTSNGITFNTSEAVELSSALYSGNNCRTDLGVAQGFVKDVSVVAAQGGDSYNVSERSYTSQYDGITGYGSVMGGGTSNIVTAVSQADCDTAKNGLLGTKTDDYKNQLSAQLTTAGLSPIRDTFVTETGEVVCSPAVGTEATESTATLTFRLSMTGANMTSLDQLVIAEIAKQDNKQSVFDTGVQSALVSLKERTAEGNVVFNLQVSAQTGMQQDAEAIANLIAGKKYGESLSIIKSQSGVADAKVSYSPFWVSGTPKDTKRINVTFISQ